MNEASLAFGRAQGRAGMERAAAGAERVHPEWLDAAYSYLLWYAERHRIFSGWMVVHSTLGVKAFPQPPNTKAWGSVLARAAKAGILERVGVVPDPNRHCAWVPQWRSSIFREELR